MELARRLWGQRQRAFARRRRCRRPRFEELEGRVTPSVTLTTLATFPAAGQKLGNGDSVQLGAGLAADSQGDVFYTTVTSGTSGQTLGGAIVELVKVTHQTRTVATFGSGDDVPNDIVIDQSGNIFGIAPSGGAYASGTVVEVPAGSHTAQTLVTFDYESPPHPDTLAGYQPGDLVLADGKLYGDATGAGSGNGILFSVPAGGGTPETVGTFANGVFAQSLTFSNGSLYGIAVAYSSVEVASAFKVSALGGAIITVGGGLPDVPLPGPTVVSGGALYGVFYTYPRLDGSILQLPVQSTGSQFITLPGSGENGVFPTDLALDGNVIVGIAESGGKAMHYGTLFEVIPGIGIEKLADFTDSATAGGGVPTRLIANSAGDLFGFSHIGKSEFAFFEATGVVASETGGGKHLVFTTQPPADVVGDEPFSITVAAELPGGVVDTKLSGTVTLTVQDDGTPPAAALTAKLASAAVNAEAGPAGQTYTGKLVKGVTTITVRGPIIGSGKSGVILDLRAASPVAGPATSKAFEELPVPPATLSSVTFGGSGFYAIASDPTPFGEVTVYQSDQWDASKHSQSPVLYAAKSTPVLSATFLLTRRLLGPVEVKAKAVGPDGFEIASTVLTQLDDYRFGLSDAKMSKAFGEKVQYYRHFAISWQLSFDGGRVWFPAGTSDDPLYVSAAAPLAGDNTPYRFLTVVNNAIIDTQGLDSSQQAELVQKTWDNPEHPSQSFAARKFTNAAGQPLYYYRAWGTTSSTVQTLLWLKDGQCGAWAGLFLDMLLVNGINYPGDWEVIQPAAKAEHLLVRNWKFGNGTSGDPRYPYVDYSVAGLGAEDPMEDVSNQYQWTHADATDEPGLPGQNNPNPDSNFLLHVVVNIEGKIYDPSYGTTYSSLADMDAKAIAGFWVLKKYVVPDSGKLVQAAYIRENTEHDVGELKTSQENWGP
jgi:hypothetical protein